MKNLGRPAAIFLVLAISANLAFSQSKNVAPKEPAPNCFISEFRHIGLTVHEPILRSNQAKLWLVQNVSVCSVEKLNFINREISILEQLINSLLELINKGPWFIVEFIQYQIELFSVPVAGHKQPPYYHFVVVLIGCMPFSLFALSNTYKKSGSEISFERIMRIVLWTVLILFTVVTTKIIHYSSMAYVPLSF